MPLIVTRRRTCHHDPIIGQQRNINRCTGPVRPLQNRLSVWPRLNNNSGSTGSEGRVEAAVSVEPGNHRIEMHTGHPSAGNHYLSRGLNDNRRSLKPKTAPRNGVPTVIIESGVEIPGALSGTSLCY